MRPGMSSSASPPTRAAKPRRSPLCRAILTWFARRTRARSFNFDTDGIRLVRKEDWLYADGTTLGSDNGVGVAAALAVMESKTIQARPHGVCLYG